MVKDTKKNGLDQILDIIIKISPDDSSLIENGLFSERIISGNSGDIKINKMEVHSNLKPVYDYHVLVSVSNGGKYQPVLYFTKKLFLDKERLQSTKPDMTLISDYQIPEFFSKAMDNYYVSKNVKYKFDIIYLNKGDWIGDILKFANIEKGKFKSFEEMFYDWKHGNV